MKAIIRTLWVVGPGALATLTGASAFAQSANPALERCRETVGLSIVAACMQQGEGSLEKGIPAVRPCMASNGGGGMAAGSRQSPTPDTGKGTLAILKPEPVVRLHLIFLPATRSRLAVWPSPSL